MIQQRRDGLTADKLQLSVRRSRGIAQSDTRAILVNFCKVQVCNRRRANTNVLDRASEQ
jgi:hypothetical protein